MLKKFLASLFAFAVLTAFPQGAIHVNRVFEDNTGNPVFNPILNPFGIQWSKSITSPSGELITVGHTNVSGQGENIFLVKHDPDGNIIFQTNYNTSGTQNDYGTSVTLDGSGNIYVCGTTDNGGSTNYDVVILKYNSSGTLQNSTTYAGGSGLNDVGTDIAVNGAGMVFVSAANENTTSGYDYLLLKFNSALSLQASGTYDYAGLNDIPGGIELNGTDVFVFGASANSLIDWDYATAKFDQSCSYGSDTRNSISGVGFDQPLAFKKDASGNMYITGKATTGAGTLDILTVKISPTFSVLWSVSYNGHGLDDVGSSLVLDGSGNVIVGGFSTKTNNKTEMVCIKYSGSNGSLMWTHKQSAENGTGDAFIKGLSINLATGNIYFVAGEDGLSGNKQVLTGRINSNGVSGWTKQIVNSGEDVLPSDIEWSNNEIYVISVLDSINDQYLTTGFTELELDTAKVYDTNGAPIYNKNQLIVRFTANSIQSNAIDNSTGTTEFGRLDQFLKPTAYSTVTTALTDACRDCYINAVKIFPGFSTTFTVTTNNLNQVVPVPDLWTALVLVFPNNTNLVQVATVFNSIPQIVGYSHPNYLAKPDVVSPPDDTLYSKQYALKSNGVYPNAHVNVAGAWNLSAFPFGFNARRQVRCGVFDCGLNWKHEEFVFNPTPPIGSRVVDGWAFAANTNLKNLAYGGDSVVIGFNNYVNHGTLVSGIIAAGRNNYKRGMAGIAGRDYYNGSDGLSMYGLKITPGSTSDICNAMNASAYTAQNFTSTPAPPYCYGLHLQNHSWGIGYPNPISAWAGITDTIVMLTREVIHNLNRLQVTLVTSRGNNGDSSLQVPATIDDDWAISVGGTGTDGQFIHTAALNVPHNPTPNGEFNASYGRQTDLAAPASSLLVLSTGAIKDTMYRRFNGTSASAPHVSGAVGLMMSYWNDTVPNLNNLAPEDCEGILQLAATNVDLPAYDVYSGWGRLNIGKSLEIIQRPFYNIHHVAADSRFSHTRTIGLVSAVDTVKLIERFKDPVNTNNWIQPGKYIVKTYSISALINHNFDIRDTIVGSRWYWPRPSSSGTWDLFQNKRLVPRERDRVSNISNASGKVWGYIYQVKDSLGNPIGWWPFDTATARNKSNLLLEYTVLTRNLNFDVGVSERKLQGIDIQLYPNPSSGKQTIEIEHNKPCDLSIELYDLMGKKLKTVYQGKYDPLRPNIESDVTNLPNSAYFYYIKIDGQSTCRKFIKQ